MRIDARQRFAIWDVKHLLDRGRWSLRATWIGLALIGLFPLTPGTAAGHGEGMAAGGAPIAVSESQPVDRESRTPIGTHLRVAARGAQRVLGVVGRWSLRVAWVGLALIGFLHLTRGTAVRHVRGIGADDTPIGVSEPEFPLKATMLTGAWMAPGNRVDIALDGDGTYPRLWEDLRSAERSIIV